MYSCSPADALEIIHAVRYDQTVIVVIGFAVVVAMSDEHSQITIASVLFQTYSKNRQFQ